MGGCCQIVPKLKARMTAPECAQDWPAKDKYCRAGCPRKETQSYLKYAQGPMERISRHNAVANYLKRALENRGYEIFSEPLYSTPLGNRKPDLVAEKDSKILVIDAQIVRDSVDLKRANARRIGYYRDNRELDESIQKHQSTETDHIGATLNFRGIWSENYCYTLGATSGNVYHP
ncbi:Retrovirus-related Pol polyprotein from type-2 retrotransposable element R2DM [Araneus ventricosus]|uniref:Retrovirus-related Pol polyprotein from type-2 retrotransposable element R2DM n=1 Tax=Araneus ventricosus TaxID=182803 RepID=A0A4Y2LCS5_ARAVE|nr:Retrovirus-related Pol polyprotein from type-2 retrotransposable element R2DM [Araneus ventricosus]